eukprot:TRINITY_DN3927_c0_g1_i7.p2 TRINITY_DN3927_c0_g1~~TRINITY_DN3927_c0_g1_i7.p2  ORF type:complete len:536 (-),score=47.77 TRINITY_DN3927_c0_g1_i7:1443-3050(-)
MIASEAINQLLDTPVEFVRIAKDLIENGMRQIDPADRQAVVIMGATGAGKSTLVNLLSGVSLVAVSDEDTGIMRIEAPEPLPEFSIGHRVASETSVPHKWRSPGGVAYWDCPGFIDNRGAVHEIANVAFVKKLFGTAEVKVLIMLKDSDLTSTRSTSILAVTKQLADLFAEDIVKLQTAISLVVSHAVGNREIQHVQRLLERVIDEAPNLSAGQRFVLAAMKSNPISIFKTPLSEGDVNEGAIREAILGNSAGWAEGINARCTLSDHASAKILAHYSELSGILQRDIAEFGTSFKDSIKNFSSECKERQQLAGITDKLNDASSNLIMQGVIEKCRAIAMCYDSSSQLVSLDDAAVQMEAIKFLEQFIDVSSKIPFDAVGSLQNQIAESKILVVNAIQAMEVQEAQAKAAEEARMKAIAEEQARQAEIARQQAEAAAAAAKRKLLEEQEKARRAAEETARLEIARQKQEQARIAAEKQAILEQARAAAERQRILAEQKRIAEAQQRAQQEAARAAALQRQLAQSDGGGGGGRCSMM